MLISETIAITFSRRDWFLNIHKFLGIFSISQKHRVSFNFSSSFKDPHHCRSKISWKGKHVEDFKTIWLKTLYLLIQRHPFRPQQEEYRRRHPSEQKCAKNQRCGRQGPSTSTWWRSCSLGTDLNLWWVKLRPFLNFWLVRSWAASTSTQYTWWESESWWRMKFELGRAIYCRRSCPDRLGLWILKGIWKFADWRSASSANLYRFKATKCCWWRRKLQ